MIPLLARLAVGAAESAGGAAVGGAARSGASNLAKDFFQVITKQGRIARAEAMSNEQKKADAAKETGKVGVNTFKQIAGTMATVSALGGQIGQMFGRIAAQPVDLLTAPLDALGAFGEKISKLVAVNNPGVAQQFQLALNDAYGVIGRMLTPILKIFTGFMRQFGNVMAALEPVIAPIIEGFGTMISILGEGLIDIIKGFAPVWSVLADVFKGLAPIIARVTVLLFKFGNWFFLLAGKLLKYLGFSKLDESRTGMGAAAKTASFMGSEELYKTLSASTVGITSGAQTPQETNTAALNENTNALARMLDGFNKFIDDITSGKVFTKEGASDAANFLVDPSGIGDRIGRWLVS